MLKVVYVGLRGGKGRVAKPKEPETGRAIEIRHSAQHRVARNTETPTYKGGEKRQETSSSSPTTSTIQYELP